MRISHIKLNSGDTIQITDVEIRKAMQQYDTEYPNNDYRDKGHAPWLEEDIHRPGSYKWAVWDKDRCYPGKYLIRLAKGINYDDFYGGWGDGQTNWVFKDLGFDVTPRPEPGK